MNRITMLPVVAMLMQSPAVLAHTAAKADTGTSTTASAAGSFDELSSGNQMIARSLMDAQVLPPDGGDVWTLDQIAAARSQTDWDNVFREMRAEGLIDAKNLGQVVSTYAHSTHIPIADSAVVEAETDQGEKATSETERGTDSAKTAAANGQSPEGATDAFDRLSPGNQKIARSLMDAQTVPADGTAEPWDLDRIAAAKGESGWGNVFREMHAEGLIDARNLGQVISRYQRGGTVAATAVAGATAVATSAGTRSGHANRGKAMGHVHTGNDGVAFAASHGNGHAYGLDRHPVSASGDVIMADGQAVSASGDAIMADGQAVSAGVRTVGFEAAGSGSHATVSAASHAAGNSAVVASSSASVTMNAGAIGRGHAYGRLK